MNDAKVKQSLQNVKKILKSCNLLGNADDLNKTLENNFYKIKSNEDLAEHYMDEINNFNFNIMLFDESILQFQFNNDDSSLKLKYCYIQFPYDFPDYKKYIVEEHNCRFNEAGYSYKSEYTQALMDAPLKGQIMILRYDYSELGYKKGIHGVSHIHIGFSNSMRITSDKILTPEAFVFFILKQIYFNYWEENMANDKFMSTFAKFKTRCDTVQEPTFFDSLDTCDFYIT